jgi:hypothetical protein
MRLSIGRVPQGDDARTGTARWDDVGYAVHGRALRRMALALSVVLVLGAIGLLFSPAKAGADNTVLAPTQVFASVGASTVNVYTPGTPATTGGPAVAPSLVTSLNDSSMIPPTSPLYPGYPSADNTAGSAFDAKGNFYVTDDYSGQISEYNPDGTLKGVFASGLQNPLSLVFDNSKNLYVGQQNTPYIAEFNSSGQNIANIGPVATGETGDDWIDLASDQCTFYYTTETNVVYRYSNCAGNVGQQANFNSVPFPGARAFQVRILPDGGALVADTNSVLRLDSNGNVTEVYPCSAADQSALQTAYPSANVVASLPDCGGQLFSLAIDPSGTSFWAGDSYSGNIWQIGLASGQVMNEVNTGAAFLYGLTVENGSEAAVTPPPAATPTTLTNPSALVNNPTFSTPTPVSSTLTNPSTGTGVAGEPVTFTLNGNPNESCTANTDANGVATCSITAIEPSSTYTLTASFSGDTTTSTPLGSNTSTGTFTVNQDTTSLTYTGPMSAVNGQPITLSGTLTDTTTGTPLPSKDVTFTIGSGQTAQSCDDLLTDQNGNASCTITPVNQPAGSEPITASFSGDTYDTPATPVTPSTLSVTEPTVLTVNTTTGEYSDSSPVSGTLTDSFGPVQGERVTFTLNNTETCKGVTDSMGNVQCSITPGESAGTYSLVGTFAGDTSTTLPIPLLQSTNSANFTEGLEETGLAYTGPTSIFNTQNLTVSGVLTSDMGATPVVGRTLTFVLGSGSSAQSCTTTVPTDSTGTGSCTINNVNQTVGPVPLTVGFTSDGYYQTANTSATVNVGPVSVGTTLTVNPGTSDYSDATTVSATLIDTYTSAGAANEPVTIKLGTQSCLGTTNASGVASCSITPNEPAGSYPLTASFAGDTTPWPHLGASTGTSTFIVTHEEAALTYTGATTAVNGSSATLSGLLTTDDPAAGTPIGGRTVTFTLGSGASAQSCSGVTNSAGAASCVIAKINQTTSPLPVTAKFAGDNYYVAASASGSVTIDTPTTLTVSGGTGTYGQTSTLTGTLTNSVTGAPISGQTVTLNLNGTQMCTAVTNSMGKASCSVTPTETAATYTVSGSFGGSTSSTVLLPSGGHNCFVVNKAPTTVTYTGQTSTGWNQTLTLSSVLTTSSGTPISGQTVVETLGSGRSAQSCTAVTNSSGVASCTVQVNQVYGSVVVTVSYGGNSYYQSSSTSSSEGVGCGGGGYGGGSGGGGSGGGGSGGGGSGGGGSPCGGGSGGGGCGGTLPPPKTGGLGCG